MGERFYAGSSIVSRSFSRGTKATFLHFTSTPQQDKMAAYGFYGRLQVAIEAESVAVTTKRLARKSRVSDQRHLNAVSIPRKLCGHP